MDKLARNASAMTRSMVSPALRHLGDGKCTKINFHLTIYLFLFYRCHFVASPDLFAQPANVVDRNVSQLLIHGRLVLPAGQGGEGGLRMFVGHIDPYFSGTLKNNRNTKKEDENRGENIYNKCGKCCSDSDLTQKGQT